MGAPIRSHSIGGWLAAAGACLAVAGLVGAASATAASASEHVGASPASVSPPLLYRVAVARGDRPPGTATLYRMQIRTGEVCAFMFTSGDAPEDRGCAGRVAGGEAHPGDRFELHVAAGFPGTNRSTAYRLDRTSGVVCRFETAHAPGGPLVELGCWLGAERVSGQSSGAGAKPAVAGLDR